MAREILLKMNGTVTDYSFIKMQNRYQVLNIASAL